MAETATVFFATTADGFQLSDLVVLDSGYLPTVLHLISAVLSLANLPASSMGFVYNFAGLMIASLPVIAFQMPVFRVLISRDSIRSMVIIVVLAFQSYWSNSNYLNSSYSMIFLLFVSGLHLAVSALASERLGQSTSRPLPTWLLCVAPLLVFTKPATLSIIPLYFCLLFLLKGRQRISAAAVVAAGFIQVMVLANSRFLSRVYEQGSEFDFVSQTFNVLAYFIAFPFRVLAGPAWTDVLLGRWWSGNVLGQWWSENNISLIFGALIILGAMLLVWKSSNLVAKIWIGASVTSLLSASILNCFTLWDSWNPDFYLYDAVPVHSRTLTMYVFALTLFIGIAMALFTKLNETIVSRGTNKWLNLITPRVMVILWITVSGWVLYIPLFADEPRWPALGSSNWASAPVNAAGDFTEPCVAIEPWAWGVYGEGCKVVGRTEHSEFSRSSSTSGSILLSPELMTGPNDFLEFVGFAFYVEPGTFASYSLSITRSSVSEPVVVTDSLASKGESTVIVDIPDGISLADVKSIGLSVDNAVLYTKSRNLSPHQVLAFVVARDR